MVGEYLRTFCYITATGPMAFDKYGHVYIANGKHVFVYSLDGQVVTSFQVNDAFIVNVCVKDDGGILVLDSRNFAVIQLRFLIEL